MEQNFQTSFIPKKPIVKERAVSSRPIGIIFIGSLLILFFVLIVTGGLYFYKGYLNKSLAASQQDLALAKERFEPSKITELKVLDRRLRASKEILAKHISVTPIFTALEELTMKTVRFTKFSYVLGADQNSKIQVQMSGIAIGYRSVALQSDLFAQNKNIIDPVFSNLTLDNSGNVLFDLQFSVDPSFVNYKQNLAVQS